MRATRSPGQRGWFKAYPTWMPLDMVTADLGDVARSNDVTVTLAPVDLPSFEPDDFPDRDISVFLRDPQPSSTLWLRYAWANATQRAYDCGKVGALAETIAEAIAGIGAKTLRDDVWVRHDYRPQELLPV